MHLLYLADIRLPLERANGIQTIETCYALAERGHDVTLGVRPDTATPSRNPFDYYGLPPLDRLQFRRAAVWGPPLLRRLCYLSRAMAWATRSRWDVVITRDLGLAALLVRLPRRARPPIVYESHGFAPAVADAMPELLSGGRRAGRLKRMRLVSRERRVWARADGYVTITSGLARELRAEFGPREPTAVLPDGVRLSPGPRPPRPRTAGDVPVIGYAGHLYPWKGVDVLLHALAEIPGVRAVIVGGHDLEPDLAAARRQAVELGLADRVTFTGWVRPPEVAGTLASADVLVLPNRASAISQMYTSPLKLFEYMALGKPIVASDLPAMREVLRDGENAVLVPPGRPDALAQGIRRVLDHPELADRIARRAFEEAPQYSWARRAEGLERLLHAVVALRAER